MMRTSNGKEKGKEMEIGEKIRHERKKKGWSLDKLAKASGSSKSYIWELENYGRRKPTVRKVKAIADALEVTVDYLTSTEQTDFQEKDSECSLYGL